MNKTLLIFKHEFLKTIRRTGFIILTLALPLLALLGIGLFHALSGVTVPPAEKTKIGYVTESGISINLPPRGISFSFLSIPPQQRRKPCLKKISPNIS